jgi:hypothetical protein
MNRAYRYIAAGLAARAVILALTAAGLWFTIATVGDWIDASVPSPPPCECGEWDE